MDLSIGWECQDYTHWKSWQWEEGHRSSRGRLARRAAVDANMPLQVLSPTNTKPQMGPSAVANTFGCTYSCYWSAEVVSHSWWAVWSLFFSPSAWILRAGIFSVYAEARSSPCSQCGPYKSSRMQECAWVRAAAANTRLSSEKLIPSSLMETGCSEGHLAQFVMVGSLLLHVNERLF